MKFTISWLKEHLDTDASVTEIAETLSMSVTAVSTALGKARTELEKWLA